jgi:hypothetical protein
MNPSALWLQFSAKRSKSCPPETYEEHTDGVSDDGHPFFASFEVPCAAPLTRVEMEEDEEDFEEEQVCKEVTDVRPPLA